jgi:hypothetical protein
MSENTNEELTPREIRDNNIALLRSNGQEVADNISKAKLEKLVAELNGDTDENDTSVGNETLDKGQVSDTGKAPSTESTSDKDVKVTPKVDIVWADSEGGILKKGGTYIVSPEDYKRIKHLVKKA